MTRGLLLLCVAALGSAVPSSAQVQWTALAQARAAGQVGERFDGYLGYASPSAAIGGAARTQTEAVNIRRRALYTGLAQRRGVSPGEVGITAGCTLLARVAVGEAYLLGDGIWRRRGANQPAPIPDYCGGS